MSKEFSREELQEALSNMLSSMLGFLHVERSQKHEKRLVRALLRMAVQLASAMDMESGDFGVMAAKAWDAESKTGCHDPNCDCKKFNDDAELKRMVRFSKSSKGAKA